MAQTDSGGTTLADKLQHLLTDQMRSGRWLARMVDMPPSTMKRVLAGERDLTLTEAAAVAKAFGIPVVELHAAAAPEPATTAVPA